MRHLVFALALFCIYQLSYAQKDKFHVSVNYDTLDFAIFISEVEKSLPVKFYYEESWIDGLKVSQKNTPSSLEDILKESLAGQDISCHIDENNNIFITRNYTIRTELPASFYNAKKYLVFDTTSKKTSHFETNGNKLNGKSYKKDDVIKIGSSADRNKGSKAIISGYVTEELTGEPILGAVVYSENTKKGTITDAFGYYVLEMPRGRNTFIFKCVGYKDKKLIVELNTNGNVDVAMEEKIIQLRNVVITAEKEHNVFGLQIGLDKLEMTTIKQIPSTMGEADVVKTAILLPGVQTVGEAASGFNVRGGSTDQNLMLIDGSPLFNTSHMFGFFSVFNPDVIKEFKLYKSGIPAKYGGRISSVFDVSTKNGNRKEIQGGGGISPLAARLIVEGPVIRDKVSFVTSARATYSDWLLGMLNRPEFRNSSASFYDLNAKINVEFNPKNTMIISAYRSKDHFQLNSDTTYNYYNQNVSVNFKHSFNKKLYGIFSGVYSKYSYDISSRKNPYSSFDMKYYIDYREAKADFSYFMSNEHSVKYGANAIFYHLNPGSLVPTGEESLLAPKILEDQRGFESAIYLSDEYRIGNRLVVEAGLRYSMFFAMGPSKVYDYSPNAPRTEAYRTDSTTYRKGEIIEKYGGPEYRISARYQTGMTTSIKFSYNRLYQYIHMLSNTTAVSPTDIWKLSDGYIPPQRGDQIALGFYKNTKNNVIESSLEVYYKHTRDLLEYKGGAVLILNDNIETDLLSGTGKSYGLEFLLKKKYGRWNGWLGYTYSRSLIQVDGRFIDEKVNDGRFYPTNYDKPHDFTLVSNYKYSRRFNISNSFTYSTGRPITYPVAKYEFRDSELLHYSERNEYRISDYFRWDLSVNLEGNLKSRKLAHSSWSFSIYNVTGRKNVYSVFFKKDSSGNIKGYTMSIFARPIYTVTYNFKF